MSEASVRLVPLVPNLVLPQPATARTRSPIPAGYGVQEQCLPFTAASALGFLIGSPIRFGYAKPEEAPEGCRMFRSPLDVPAEQRVFYVFDNPDCRFRGNAYSIEGVPADGSAPFAEPGISFFDRPDQQHLFKLHLPYVWRTPEAIDTLFLPLINRAGLGFEVQCGLVETDWYPSPVNLILSRPPGATHVAVGDPVAHAILIPRDLRRPALEVAEPHARLHRETRKALAQWDEQHNRDRAAYKVLARSRHGRVE